MKKLLPLFLVFTLLCCLTVTAFAGGTVTYDGNAQEFIFASDSEHAPTDLFSEFHNVMPGDQLTQRITVRNDIKNNCKVKIYIRSLGAQPDSQEFLSQLQMTVAKTENNTMEYMFNATADQTAGLTDWVLLGTLYSGGEVNLEITLDVPIELGNEYQESVAYLDWQFKVEEYPVEPDDPRPPDTGDSSNIIYFVCIMALSLAILAFLLLLRKRKN